MPFVRGLYKTTEDLTDEDIEKFIEKQTKTRNKLDSQQEHLEDFDDQQHVKSL